MPRSPALRQPQSQLHPSQLHNQRNLPQHRQPSLPDQNPDKQSLLHRQRNQVQSLDQHKRQSLPQLSHKRLLSVARKSLQPRSLVVPHQPLGRCHDHRRSQDRSLAHARHVWRITHSPLAANSVLHHARVVGGQAAQPVVKAEVRNVGHAQVALVAVGVAKANLAEIGLHGRKDNQHRPVPIGRVADVGLRLR